MNEYKRQLITYNNIMNNHKTNETNSHLRVLNNNSRFNNNNSRFNNNNSRFNNLNHTNYDKQEIMKKTINTDSMDDFPSLGLIKKTNINANETKPINNLSSWASLASTNNSNSSTILTQYRDSKRDSANEKYVRELSERCKQHSQDFKNIEHLISNGEYCSDSEDSIHEYVEHEDEEYSDNNIDF